MKLVKHYTGANEHRNTLVGLLFTKYHATFTGGLWHSYDTWTTDCDVDVLIEDTGAIDVTLLYDLSLYTCTVYLLENSDSHGGDKHSKFVWRVVLAGGYVDIIVCNAAQLVRRLATQDFLTKNSLSYGFIFDKNERNELYSILCGSTTSTFQDMFRAYLNLKRHEYIERECCNILAGTEYTAKVNRQSETLRITRYGVPIRSIPINCGTQQILDYCEKIADGYTPYTFV